MSAKIIHSDIPSHPHYVLKCLFVGEPYAGKTSFLLRLADESYFDQRDTTIGIDFRSLNAIGEPKSKTPHYSDVHDPKSEPTHYKLQCWDCAGQIRFRSIVKSYYRYAQLVFVVFDLTDRVSFDAAKVWIEDVRANASANDEPLVVILIGNKCDLIKRDRIDYISPEEIQKMVHETKCDAYQAVSAKTGDNVEKAFNVGLAMFHHMVIEGKIKLQQPFASVELPSKSISAPAKLGRFRNADSCC